MRAQKKSYVEISLLLSIFLVLPFVDGERKLGVMLVQAVFSLLLVGMAYSACPPGLARQIGMTLAILAAGVGWLGILFDSLPLLIADGYLMLAALGFLIYTLSKNLMGIRTVSAHTLRVAMATYMLIGVMWAVGFDLLSRHDPGAFSGITWQVDDSRLSAFMYYSFVTLTTLGYGDMAPASAVARILAVMEALLGQLFVVVLIARIVGLQVSSRRDVEAEKD